MADESPSAPPAEARKPAATIYDVAREAGVSPSTVSRALNKPGRITEKTEKRIREAASRLDYRLNPMARALPTGRTSTLGLILSDITNPVYFDLIRGAQKVTATGDYTLVVAESQESSELELETAERIAPSVDGLILVATRLSDDDIRMLAARKPLILVNREVAGVPSVVPDVAPGISTALDHLSGLGHRSLAFLAGPASSWMSRLRGETLQEEAARRGMALVEIGPGVPTLEGGKEGLGPVLASGASAVLAYNDLMAIGLLLACQAADIEIPASLSIVGFDDIFGSDFTSPPITTIRTPLAELGERAAQLVLAEVDGSAELAPPRIGTEFVLRGSTAAPSIAGHNGCGQ